MSRGTKKSERLHQILLLLLEHPEGLPVRELARRLGVHRATVHRDLDDLSREYPVHNDGGRWFVRREAFRVQVPLNLHEAMALYLAVRMMTTRTDKHNPHAAAALRHLARALESVAHRVAAFIRLSAEVIEQTEGRRQDPRYLQVLETLTRAWAEGRKVKVWHRHEATRRVYEYTFSPYFIEPYPIGQTAHVIGYREPPGKLRTFKIERIERVELLPERYTIPDDFDPREILRDAWGIWFTDKEPVEVVLRFHPRVVNRVLETVWHPSQQTAYDDQGWLIWRARVAEPQEMLPWIRGWGADVEVLAPEDLRRRLRAETRVIAERYGWTVGQTAREGPPSPEDTFDLIFGG